MAAAEPGQVVTCEYCGTRNVVHARGVAGASGDVSAQGAQGVQGVQGVGSSSRPPPPGFGPAWSGSAPLRGMGTGNAGGAPQPTAHHGAVRRAVILGAVSMLMVTGSVVYFMAMSPSSSSPGSDSEGTGAQTDRAQAERERRQANRQRRTDEGLSRRPRATGGKAGQTGLGSTSSAPGGGDLSLSDVGEGETAGEAGEAGPLQFESDRPLVMDVNGDGVEDLVARVRRGAGREVAVVALSGKSWQELWRHQVVGSRASKLHEGGELVFVSQGNQLTALESASGARRWMASVEDGVSIVLPRGDRVAVLLRNGVTLELLMATGAPYEHRAKAITELTRDDSRLWVSNLGRDFPPPREAKERLRFEMFYCPDGMLLWGKTVTRTQGPITDKRTTYGCKAPRALSFATQAKGTRIPYLVGLGRGGKLLWEERLTPPESLEAVSGTPAADLHGDHAAVAYQLGRGSSFLLVAELTGGKVLWRKALAEGQPRAPSVRGVVLGRDRIYLRVGSELWVFGLTDGKRLR